MERTAGIFAVQILQEMATKAFQRERVRGLSERQSSGKWKKKNPGHKRPVPRLVDIASDNLRIAPEDDDAGHLQITPLGPAQPDHRTAQKPWPNVHW